jgi:hypothetical protein
MFAKHAMLCAFAVLFVGSVTAATVAIGAPKHDKKKNDDDKKPAATAADNAGQITAEPKHKDHKKKDDDKLTVREDGPSQLINLYAESTPLKPGSYRGNVGHRANHPTHRHCHRQLAA